MVNDRAERAFGLFHLPGERFVVFAVGAEAEGAERSALIPQIADAEQETVVIAGLEASFLHRTAVVRTRMDKAELVVAVPFAEVDEAIGLEEISSYLCEVVDILIEECLLMVCFWTRAYDIHDDRQAAVGPEAEELAASFLIRVVLDAARYVVHLAAINNSLVEHKVSINKQTCPMDWSV